jgi:hypothetical protein
MLTYADRLDAVLVSVAKGGQQAMHAVLSPSRQMRRATVRCSIHTDDGKREDRHAVC